MFAKSSWMSAVDIVMAQKMLRSIAANEFHDSTKSQVDGALEGLSCLEGARPGYLVNLIPQDHPDRKMAVRLLTE